MDNYNPFQVIDQRLANIERLLSKVSQPQHLPTPVKQLEGGIELAKEILKVYSKSSIYKMSMDGRIPHTKRGRKLWFSRIELEAWIAQGMPDVSKQKATDRLASSLRKKENL
ncbi:MAG: helix-turn-helix domain-containing protein [Bacteroidales bacterium]|nr:helix-turn-helix domain-containing protein [Bacteroidales bacterium]MBN2749045.1 helix-turn-helix domain-containing protein [Bacteroidales bacterium]